MKNEVPKKHLKQALPKLDSGMRFRLQMGLHIRRQNAPKMTKVKKNSRRSVAEVIARRFFDFCRDLPRGTAAKQKHEKATVEEVPKK